MESFYVRWVSFSFFLSVHARTPLLTFPSIYLLLSAYLSLCHSKVACHLFHTDEWKGTQVIQVMHSKCQSLAISKSSKGMERSARGNPHSAAYLPPSSLQSLHSLQKIDAPHSPLPFWIRDRKGTLDPRDPPSLSSGISAQLPSLGDACLARINATKCPTRPYSTHEIWVLHANHLPPHVPFRFHANSFGLACRLAILQTNK